MLSVSERIRDEIRGHWYGTTVLAIGLLLYLGYLVIAVEPPSVTVFIMIVLVSVVFGAIRYERPAHRESMPLWVEILALVIATGIGIFLTIVAGKQIVSFDVLAWSALFAFVVSMRVVKRLLRRVEKSHT